MRVCMRILQFHGKHMSDFTTSPSRWRPHAKPCDTWWQ